MIVWALRLAFVAFAVWRISRTLRKWPECLVWILITVGVGLNLFVMAINGGRMPVYGLPSVTDNVHVAMVGRNARLFWLCDIIGNGYFRMSVGDLFLITAFVLILAEFCVAFVRSVRRLHDANL